MLTLQFQYDRVVLRRLKTEIPKGLRRWNSDVKAWEVEDRYLYTVAEILQDHDPQLVRSLILDPKYAMARDLSEGRRNAQVSSRATDADIDIPCPKGLAYLPFQKAGIAYAQKRKSTLIADEMGLGKTIQALGYMNLMTPSRVLVICPANLRLNWQRESIKWLVKDSNVKVIRSKSGWEEVGPNSVCIINFDILGRFIKEIQSVQWDLLIVDECHYIKNYRESRNKLTGEVTCHGAQRSKHTFAIASRVPSKLFLTGTPIVNRPKELWPIVRALDPGYWRKQGDFLFHYCDARQNAYGWDFSGASNLEELQERLRESVMVRRLKSEVLKDLPDKTRQVIAIPSEKILAGESEWEKNFGVLLDKLSKLADDTDWSKNKQRKAYETAVRKLKSAANLSFSECSKARYRTAMAKLPFVVDFIKEVLEVKDKVVVFAHHKDVVNSLMDTFDGVAVKLVGGMSEKAKDESVTRFQTDPKVKVFVGNIMAAGVGITLTASDTVIFAELDWVPGNLSQAEDRCHRIGQANAVNVYHIVIDKSLDARLANTVVEKQKVIDAALNKRKKGKRKSKAIKPVAPLLPQLPREDAVRPAISLEDRETVHSLLKWLSSYCDGAYAKDGQGFNKLDADFGRSMAKAVTLTDNQYEAAVQMLQKYRKQIVRQGVMGFYKSVFITERVGA